MKPKKGGIEAIVTFPCVQERVEVLWHLLMKPKKKAELRLLLHVGLCTQERIGIADEAWN